MSVHAAAGARVPRVPYIVDFPIFKIACWRTRVACASFYHLSNYFVSLLARGAACVLYFRFFVS